MYQVYPKDCLLFLARKADKLLSSEWHAVYFERHWAYMYIQLLLIAILWSLSTLQYNTLQEYATVKPLYI